MQKCFAILTLVTLFSSPAFVHAQSFEIDKPPLPIDSLEKALPLLHDSARVDCLIELSRSYFEAVQKRYSDSAMATVRQAYKEASALNYIKGLGDACLQLGVISFWHLCNFIESEKNYREAISWHQKIQNHNGLGFGYRGLGSSLFNQGSADEAIKAFEQSVLHFRKAGNQVMLADLTDWFGYVYELKEDFEKHFEYVKKALQEKKRINDNRGIIWSFYNLSQIYQLVGDYETALDYLRQSSQQATKQSIKWQPYRSMGHLFLYMGNYDSSIYYFQEMLQIKPSDGPALAGLGKLYMFRKEYDKALDYLQQALIIFEKTTDPGRGISVKVDVGKTFTGMKLYSKALEYARECLTMASQTDNKPVMQSGYEIHWKVYEELKNTDSTYFYFQKFVTLKDSLEDAKFKLQYLQKLALYNVETKEEQQQAHIDLLNKDNQVKQQHLQKEALQKKILIGSLAALGLMGIIFLRNITLKRKNEKHRREMAENELKIQKLENERTKAELQQQATELEMQALRAQMKPHFIFNSLNSINSFILQNNRAQASEYLTKFSRLVRMILQNSQASLITLESELESLKLYLDLESLRFNYHFDYKISVPNDLDISVLKVPPLIIQPYVENAIWHGLMHKEEKGQLDIEVSQEDDFQYFKSLIMVSDAKRLQLWRVNRLPGISRWDFR